jgi:hypothetical protein
MRKQFVFLAQPSGLFCKAFFKGGGLCETASHGALLLSRGRRRERKEAFSSPI